VARRLALIAHDNKKVDLVAWATFNRKTLAEFDLMATRHTARLVREKVGLEAEELLSDVVFFFVDPLWSQPHDPDIRALLCVCNVHNVLLATNLKTADLIITALAPRVALGDGTEEAA